MAEKMASGNSKPTAKKKINKGDAYLCEICSLQVNVDLCGEFLESKGLSCCGKPMKQKVRGSTNA